MRNGGLLAASETKKRKRRTRLTLAMVRAKCGECLNLQGNRCRGYDCAIDDCPLYPVMPWRGTDMPERMT